jgi:phytoene synthase
MADTLAEALRRRDPDRYYTALFAPETGRNTLFTLYAFNHELARAPEAAREPGLALIRLQWWREVVEGEARAHEVATPLRAALSSGRLHGPDLLTMIEAREREVEGLATLSEWRDWLLQGAGSLAVAAGRTLGAPDAALPSLRALGAGYGVAGQLRSIGAFARGGRCLLPADLLSECGVTASSVIADPGQPGLAAVREPLVVVGWQLLGAAVARDRAWIAAALPAVLARRDLLRPGHAAGRRSLSDRLAVLAAVARGRA